MSDANDTATDERPALWVGHVIMRVSDVPKAVAFWTTAGMRELEQGDAFGILELRGGTHLIVLASDEPVTAGTAAPFDLMVDDVDAAHARYRELGLAPSDLQRGEIHDSFTLTDPSGYAVTVILPSGST